MIWLKILLALPVGLTALFFLIVTALYIAAVWLAKFGIGHPVTEMLPDPHTGEPKEHKAVLRFNSRLSLLFVVITGHQYAQTLAWPVRMKNAVSKIVKVFRIVVCLPDNDISGETFYHEVVIHGDQWLRYRFRMLFLQSRAVLFHGYRGSEFERHAYHFGALWKDVSPSYRLDPAKPGYPAGVLVKEYKNPKARKDWEEKHGIRPLNANG